MEADVEAVKEKQMELNRLYASAEQDKAELQRDWDVTKESLQQANEKIDKLQKENATLHHTLEAYQCKYPGGKMN